ncbi:MAG: hypothetical protein HDR09_20175 [Lachnospiraceae bacterium]|nr:hypothetical protein [Lachnospiraceae bacterium]MBD5505993.1 hypothetical protein [Lachnospiraceae bacterium]
MPYRHEICKAGKTKQHTYYYAARADTKEGSRRKKENETSEAQKKVNSRQAVKKLTWIFNENYDGTSLYVTWSFAKENRPEGKEELRAVVDKLLRDIRKEYKVAGDIAKYVWVAEVGERGATHIHMVLNAIDIARLKKYWDKGWIDIKPMDDSGQYRKLAAYFVKYSEKTMKTCEGFSGRRYNSSKNLKIPQPTKTTVRSKNAYNHTIEIPQGWYLDKDSVAEAWHEITGFMYFTYTLIYDGKSSKQTKDTYTLDLETGEVEISEKPRKEKKQHESRVQKDKVCGRTAADIRENVRCHRHSGRKQDGAG